MTIDQVLRHYGGKDKCVQETARALGFTSAAVYGWVRNAKEGKAIPKRSQLVIELHSKGKLKASK